jgi:DNA-binding response OmpR family regulator
METMVDQGQTDEAAAILVIDDDLFIAFAIEDIVARAGYRVVGPATSIEDGLRLVEHGRPTAALVDVRLGNQDASELARELQARSIPFAFVATYAERSAVSGFRDVPFLPKPFEDGMLLGLVNMLVKKASQAPAHFDTGV